MAQHPPRLPLDGVPRDDVEAIRPHGAHNPSARQARRRVGCEAAAAGQRGEEAARRLRRGSSVAVVEALRGTPDHAAAVSLEFLDTLFREYGPREFGIRLWDGTTVPEAPAAQEC